MVGTITEIFGSGTRRGCFLSKGCGGYNYDLRYLQKVEEKVEEKAESGVDHKPTQNTRILDYMQEFGGITQLEALRDLGVMRLASRISDMRRLGYDIESETVPVKNRWGETCYIKKYKLGGDKE
ncbi:MAG: helix-turn-helix domain-containing protein [Clostridia bacterium]|nr:helix-turn-helix domain-containing protein [Clostridia bacterium]